MPATSVIVIVPAGRPATTGGAAIVVAHKAAPLVALGFVVAATATTVPATRIIIAAGGTSASGGATIVVAHEPTLAISFAFI